MSKKQEKPWSEMSEDEWKKERERTRKIQDRHFQNAISGEVE